MPGTKGSGPRSAPTALKLLRGDKKSRINQEEPELELGDPYRPTHLSKRAREEWDRQMVGLLEKGVISVHDGNVLAEFCEAVAEIERLTKLCRKPYGRVDKNGKKTANALLLREANEARRRCEIELGLTPSARTRVKAIKKPKKNKFSDL